MDRPQGAGKIDSEQKDGWNPRQQVAEHALASQKELRNQTLDLYIQPGPCPEINLRRKVFNMNPALLEGTPSHRRWFSGRVGDSTRCASQPSARGKQGEPSRLPDANDSFLFVSGGQGVLLRNERDLDLVFPPSL